MEGHVKRAKLYQLFNEWAAQREAEQEGQATFERACRAAPSVAWREVSSPLDNAARAIRERAQALGLDDLTFPACIELAKAAGVEE